MKKNFLLATIAAFAVATASAASMLPAATNGTAFINNYDTRVRLQKLVGTNVYNQIRKNFQVVSTLQSDEDITAFSGCQKNNCADTESLVVYDRNSNVLSVWYHHGEKVLRVQEKGEMNEDNFGVDLQDAIDSIQSESQGNDGL